MFLKDEAVMQISSLHGFLRLLYSDSHTCREGTGRSGSYVCTSLLVRGPSSQGHSARTVFLPYIKALRKLLLAYSFTYISQLPAPTFLNVSSVFLSCEKVEL